ncbi:Mothers against decapentaplegic-like 6, partial [Ophiophagus hannah]
MHSGGWGREKELEANFVLPGRATFGGLHQEVHPPPSSPCGRLVCSPFFPRRCKTLASCGLFVNRAVPFSPADTTLSRCSLRDGYWCKLAYWEYRLRVGRLYPVHGDYVCVFSNLPNGNGLCLGQLASRNRSPAVRRTQAKIGRGLLLSQEASGVWAYNRSEHPLFVCSPTLGTGGSSAPPVHKILPGYSIKVFDYERATHLAGRRPGAGEGPHDGHTIRISFGKGWGASYTRRFITSCPCWLEVLLNTPR